MSQIENAGTWDYVVVGGGSAGCVVASRLSEDPGCRVLLLEAGAADTSPLLRIPGAVRFTIGSPKFDWNVMSEPDVTRHGRREVWNRGKVLGGSSAINGMIYVRGPAADYDSLGANEMPGWSYADVLPYFRKSEDFEGPESASHGKGGPQPVSRLRTPHKLSQAFLQACTEAGLPVVDDLNDAATPVGFTLTQATQRNGARVSAAHAFLHPARNRSNLKVTTDAHVHRVVVEGGRAVGVEYEHGGRLQHVRVNREVIVCAGALMSPQILMLSGIGPREELARHGIATVVDAPDVGSGFHDHPDIGVTYEVNEATLNMRLSIGYMAMYGARWLITRDGPVASTGCQVYGLLKSRPELPTPDLQFYFTPNGYRLEPGKIVFNREPTVSLYCGVPHPKSRGSVRLHDANPRSLPALVPRMLEAKEDLDTLWTGAQLARRILNETSFKRYLVRESKPGADVTSREAFDEFARETSTGQMHASGTCRMGTDARSVVDPQLRVRGVEGLRVADMAVVPRVPAANTNAVALMVGERCADIVRQAAIAPPAAGPVAVDAERRRA